MTAHQVPPAVLIKKIRQNKTPLTGIQTSFDNQTCPVFQKMMASNEIEVSFAKKTDLSLLSLLPSECPDRFN